MAFAQTLRTGQMKVNPYMAFAPFFTGKAEISPSIDRWTESEHKHGPAR